MAFISLLDIVVFPHSGQSIHLFSRYALTQNIWKQTQIFFLNYPITLKITLQSIIFGFIGGLHDEHSILINHILLIYKYHSYESKNSETLNFIGLKNNILKTKKFEESMAGSDFYKMCNFIKTFQVISKPLNCE